MINIKRIDNLSIIIKIVLVATMLMCITRFSFAQSFRKSEKRQKSYSKMYVGVGVGFDYGGIGLKGEYLPVRWLGLWGGIGHNFHAIGVNAGVSLKTFPYNDVRPVLVVMYGYNAVHIVKDRNGNVQYKQTYYGITFGGGGEFDVGKKRNNKISATVFFPMRSQQFHDDVAKSGADVLPFSISLGYNISIF